MNYNVEQNQIPFGVLIKFGDKEHINDLLLNGTLYCNTVRYFREIEDNKLRGDEFEGAKRLQNFDFRTKEEIQSNEPGLFRITTYDLENPGNVYCLYAITADDLKETGSHTIDSRNASFGTHGVIINDVNLFWSKLAIVLKEKGLDYEHGLVSNYDTYNYSGGLSIFHKPEQYSYQREYRIYIPNKFYLPLVLRIGSIEDFAVSFEMEELIN